MFQVMPKLDMCLNVGTGVMGGALSNLMLMWNYCCILFNLTWASFLRYIVHSPVEAYRGHLV